MRLPRRISTWLIFVWSGLMVWLYVETVSSNCGNENDCGAAVGLGFLMTVMIWTLGFAFLIVARLSRAGSGDVARRGDSA